jgi:hypothetical protein
VQVKNGVKERLLLPQLAECVAPLRMRVTPINPAVKGSEETLTLQDATGKQSFRGTHGSLESSYIIVIEERAGGGSASSATATYSVLPVSHWVNFTRAPAASQLTPDEQAELYDMLQKYGDRPTRASRALERFREAQRGGGKFTDEGGLAGGELEDSAAGGFGGNYRSSMTVSARGGGGGRKRKDAAEDGHAFDGDDFEAAYEAGGGGGGGDGGAGAEDEFGDVEDAEARVRARDGCDYAEDAAADRNDKEFDVVGDEAGGTEMAADVMQDYFADDAGDDGGFADEDGVRLDKEWGADGEAGGAAAARGGLGEEELGVDLDADLDGDDLAKAAAAAVAASASRAAVADADEARAGKRGATSLAELEGRAAKRSRFDAGSQESMREELVSFIRAQGGKTTAVALSRAFGQYVTDPTAKARLFALLGEVTKQVREAADKKLYFVLIKK